VQAVTIAEVADELYSLTPAEFTAARDERARGVRVAGQRELAAAIKKLARPTAGAWLVNQLVRQAQDRMTRLYEIGEALQEAQRTLAGDRLRELSSERRHVINELLPEASGLAEKAGQPASAAVLDEVRATLEAAMADAGARHAVRSGRLTKGLAYAGLGEVDLSAALALPAEPRAGKRQAAAAGTPHRPEADQPPRAADALQAAKVAADEAAAALEQAEQDLAGVAEQRQFLRRRIQHLERELAQARTEDARLADDSEQAERSRDAAARELEAVGRRLAQARQRASGR
jgi:hypothetical protein